MDKYFLHDGENHVGPLSLEDLKAKNITKETPIWFEGISDWTNAGEVDELKTLFIPTPPPLIKPAVESTSLPKITPPPIVKTDTEKQFEPAQMTETKKSNSTLYWIIGASIGLLLIIVIVYQNATHSKEIEAVKETNEALNSQVNTVKEEVERQNLQKQQEDAERETRNQALTAKNMQYRNNWASYITANTGTYSYRAMGGISDLGITVSNSTEYSLDEVNVEIYYIQANGGTFKTETVSLNNITPNSSKRVGAPNSDRGLSVKIRIVSITAKSFKFCYNAYGAGNGNPRDRWQCD